MWVSRTSTDVGRWGYGSGRASAAGISSMVRNRDDPPSGDGPGADANPMAARPGRPHLEAELVESADLARGCDLFGHADDHDAPAVAAARSIPSISNAASLALSSPMQLRPRRGAKHHALRARIEHVVERPDDRRPLPSAHRKPAEVTATQQVQAFGTWQLEQLVVKLGELAGLSCGRVTGSGLMYRRYALGRAAPTAHCRSATSRLNY